MGDVDRQELQKPQRRLRTTLNADASYPMFGGRCEDDCLGGAVVGGIRALRSAGSQQLGLDFVFHSVQRTIC